MPRPSFRVVALCVVCLLLAGLAWVGARWAERLPARIQAATEEEFRRRAVDMRARFFEIAHFEPRIRVREKVIAESNAEIAELAFLEKNTEVSREFTHTWAGSTKTLRLRGKYRVKIGSNLLNRFEIQVEKSHRRILLPTPGILSVEQTDLRVESLENGLWNPVSADDLQESIAALQRQARDECAGLVGQARDNFARRLQGISDAPVEVVFLESGKS